MIELQKCEHFLKVSINDPACRHPDWTGPDDLKIKILELREITNWQVPIFIKIAGARPYYDTTLAIKAGADVVGDRWHARRYCSNPRSIY
jgi:glutamate synthase domain-containing protein 2